MKAALPLAMLALGLGGCVAAPSAPAPAPAPTSASAPRPVAAAPALRPSVAQAPADDRWMDAPATLGAWTYENRGSVTLALFEAPGRGTLFAIQCRAPSSEVWLVMAGQTVASPTLQVRTETTTRAVRAQLTTGERSNVTAALPGNDPLLDAMALSKGRFAVETEGLPPLYLPSWAEVTRVIEDCR